MLIPLEMNSTIAGQRIYPQTRRLWVVFGNSPGSFLEQRFGKNRDGHILSALYSTVLFFEIGE